MAHEAGRRLLVAACALAAAAGLTACRSDDGARVAAPSAGRASTSAGSPSVPGTPAGHSLVSAAERWIEHPDEAPDGVTDAGLLLNERGRGSRSFALPNTRADRTLLMTATCAPDGSPYRLELQDAAGRVVYWSSSACPGLSSALTSPLDPADPPVAVRVEVSAGTDYWVTVYGQP